MPIVKPGSGSANTGKTQKSLFSFFCKVDSAPPSTSKEILGEAASSPQSTANTVSTPAASSNISKSTRNIAPLLKEPKLTSPASAPASAIKRPSIEESPVTGKIKSPIKSPKEKQDEDDLLDSDDDIQVTGKKRTLGKAASKPPKVPVAKKPTKENRGKGKLKLDSDDEEFSADDESIPSSDDDYQEHGSEDDEEGDEELSESGDSFIDDSEDDEGYSSKKKKGGAKAKAGVAGRKTTKTVASKKTTGIATGNSAKKTPSSTGKYSLIMESTPQRSSQMSTPNKSNLLNTPASDLGDSDAMHSTQNTPSKVYNLPEGVVGQGSHEHNSYDFLKPENRRDANNLPPDHPDYNPRTLKVPSKYLNEQTPAMAQWWQFKSMNMDTILFFKVGKFYELFHMDADVAFSELDLIYMKGTKAHSGFPEVSYGKFASILVSKGYRVARVEQTETPEMLKERNDAAGKGVKKDKVVTRELCSIMTKGTRTYCHLDDLSILEDGSSADTAAISTSLLVAIKETSLCNNSDDSKMEIDEDEDQNEATAGVVEYGITAIDTVLGTVTLAQFQDDNQRNRLRAFLARYMATEVLFEHQGISKETEGVIRLVCPKASLEYLRTNEMPTTALDVVISILKAQYFGLSEVYRTNSNNSNGSEGTNSGGSSRYHSDLKRLQHLATTTKANSDLLELVSNMTSNWPELFQAVLQGLFDTGSTEQLVISFGAALWQLKRSLIDYDVLSMGKFFGYIPPDEEEAKQIIANANANANAKKSAATVLSSVSSASNQTDGFDLIPIKEEGQDEAMELSEPTSSISSNPTDPKHMVLDEIALTNLEVLVNNYDRSEIGSLWQFVNRCKTIGGKRLLRNWLIQPLFQIPDIEKRRLAIRELIDNSELSNVIEKDVKKLLKQIPDLERLLCRVHVNGLKRKSTISATNPSANTVVNDHPDVRAVMFEAATYTIRKIKEFADILSGFETVLKVIDLLNQSTETIQSPLLRAIIRKANSSNNGSNNSNSVGFPYEPVHKALTYFRTIFDEKSAKKDGQIRPKPGINTDYDEATAEIEELEEFFRTYLTKMKKETGISDIKYFGNGKDRYQLEIPINNANNSHIPTNWITKSQKKTHRRYWTKEIEINLSNLIHAEEKASNAAKDTLRSIFAKFDSMRDIWEKAALYISYFDALLSLAQISSLPGYHWPIFKRKDSIYGSELKIIGGRHPMLEHTLALKAGTSFIPNDLTLGGHHVRDTANNDIELFPRTLLLTGANMAGKSTLLRQTCLIVILAQLGCAVPADSCVLTPVDRIFTRVGASDRILAGQSTFFVELAETSLILKAATEDSLCILDELGRGTATFDGTAIAHAVVDHLISKIKCRTLFATHYHLLIEDWEMDPRVKLGHMDCFVEDVSSSLSSSSSDDAATADVSVNKAARAQEVTFLYKLCDGSSPKSYGINVARLAGMPASVLALALSQSEAFEAQAKDSMQKHGLVSRTSSIYERILSINEANLTKEEYIAVIYEIWRRYQVVKDFM